MSARLAALVVTAACATMGLPTQALAAVVTPSLDGSSLLYFAEDGEDNALTVSLSAGTYTFTEAPGVVITPLGPTCSSVPEGPPTNVVTCSATGISGLEIFLFDGDDEALVSAPTDTILRGGLGDDRLTGGSGDDQLNGDESNVGGGSDTLIGNAGDDELNGEPPPFTSSVGGANNLDGGPGADFLNGGGGRDTANGGDDADRVFGYAGADDLDGADGSDLVVGGDGSDAIGGGEGNDRLGDDATATTNGFPPDRGSDAFDGGPGDDLLRPGLGPTQGVPDSDTLNGGGGRDSVTYEQRAAPVTVSINGAPGDGFPGEGDNVGLDVERLVGGRVADRLSGGPTNDSIDGLTGADVITGGAGADTLDGGVLDAESDNVAGGDGDDLVRGNAGDDTLNGDRGRDGVEGGGGDDAIAGGQDNDNLAGGAGADRAEGGAGNDRLNGSTPALVGADGADVLRGDAGNDSLTGAEGNDTLVGGSGADDMKGGLGRDAAEDQGATSDVTVVLDDRPNDGQRGEGDNVRTDVEDVRGGGVQDTFTGSAGANDLDAGAGEDFVDGRRGRDELRGGGSRDVVRARDGNRDLVDCGRSADFAIVDRRDVVRENCERRDAGRARARLGRAVVVQPRGKGLQFGLPRTARTVPLLDRIRVPVASLLDARRGSVRLTSARTRTRRQSAIFSAGLFTVLQSRSRRPVTEVRLKGGNFRRCGARAGSGRVGAAQRRRRTVRRLRGNARGRFRTRGRYSAATVRGTVYTVVDRCDGTLTRVRRGVVLVRDFRRRVTIRLRAGRSYLARAP